MSAPPAPDAAERYNAWYRTRRGEWIGDAEFWLLARMLALEPGESLLDIGCGTGYFAGRFARDRRLRVAGLDPNVSWLAFARGGSAACEVFVAGKAERLPFPDRSLDRAVSVTALCFVADQRRALQEMVRVTRTRLALGLLNRYSLLYLKKGRGGGVGAYRNAHWHTPDEVRHLFDGLPVRPLELRSAIFLPGGGLIARTVEAHLPDRWLHGGLLAVAATVAD